MKQYRINRIFHTLYKFNPNPQIELEYVNNFTLLIAVILSAQTTDKMVNKVTRNIFPYHNTPEQILLLGEHGLIDKIKSIGLYKNKAKHIINLCKILIERYSGEVPDNFDDLIRLPGVGRKTADFVLNSGFNKETIAVDRHIYRVVHRTGITNGKNANEVADNLLKIVPKSLRKEAHHLLVLHGRHVCKAKGKLCCKCSISKLCDQYRYEQTQLKSSLKTDGNIKKV